MTIVYILIAVAVLAGIYFAFVRKKEPEALPPAEDRPKPKLPEKAAPQVDAQQAPREERRAPAPLPPKPVKGEPRVEESARREEPATLEPISKRTKKDVEGLRRGLSKTRTGFIARLTALFSGKKEIDPAILEQMEEVMLSSDVGVKTTQAILGRLRERLARNEVVDRLAVWSALRTEASAILGIGGGAIRRGGKPTVVLMVGVNGVGKTTTIGKLATRAKNDGMKVFLAAGDTFRAGAVKQLELWGARVGADVVKGKEGSDPGAVAFEATTKAREASADLLFVDTAGRLHTKSPLMDEIKKVKKTIAKALDGAPHETLLVLDATTGQNGLTQAAMFKEALELTGIVLTKLDGTAKGGIVLSICDELKVPVRYVGLGERPDDLRDFDADEFVEALFGDGAEAVEAA